MEDFCDLFANHIARHMFLPDGVSLGVTPKINLTLDAPSVDDTPGRRVRWVRQSILALKRSRRPSERCCAVPSLPLPFSHPPPPRIHSLSMHPSLLAPALWGTSISRVYSPPISPGEECNTSPPFRDVSCII